MDGIYLARDVWAVHMTLTVHFRKPEPANSWFGYYAYWLILSVRFECEADGKINFNHIYLKLIFCCLQIYLICNIFLTSYGSWTWAKSNGAFYGDACAEWRSLKRGVIVCWQSCSTLCGMFVQPFSFVSYYLLELNLMILFLIFGRHITADWRRDTSTILQPTRILIRICGWGRIVWWTW
jgi:hypothetical protein